MPGLFKRSQKEASDSSKHWYQDKYQHVLVQRNILALVALGALLAALVAVFAVMRLAPLKSVEPYLIEIDPKTGITQKVEPVSRYEYAANEAVDRYFVSAYIRARESYNFSTTRYNFNLVRVMSTPNVFYAYRHTIDPSAEGSLASTLGTLGLRSVKFRSISYLSNPLPSKDKKDAPLPSKIIQARIVTTDSKNGGADTDQYWVVTVTFQYANLNLNVDEQLLNPLGFNVISYQVQKELS
jgi:type IV secretion system protein VirB8